ncbi:MAG: hypothetical protein ACREV7_11335 [Steroidobacteraceae bacterium]
METSESMLLTIFLKHDQSQDLDALIAKLDAKGWWEHFPPEGVEIVGWNVVMGIGHVVTLRFPPRLLHAVNLEVERRAWGAFSTEFYASYDFMPARERLRQKRLQNAK